MSDRQLSHKERMLRGELYNGFDPELADERQWAEVHLLRFNTSTDFEERGALLRIFLGAAGPGCFIRPSFLCDYGYNIFLGKNVFLNCNCVLLDVMPIHIGDGTQIGPAVQIYTADHPRDRQTRLAGLEFGKPVTVGRNVWIGGGAILLPGVTVGDDAIIGAGSVVTRDVPEGATVVGNPARSRQADVTG
ncbi:MAG: sugar O-acetyltransferase [Janthinobacterium lividum]